MEPATPSRLEKNAMVLSSHSRRWDLPAACQATTSVPTGPRSACRCSPGISGHRLLPRHRAASRAASVRGRGGPHQLGRAARPALGEDPRRAPETREPEARLRACQPQRAGRRVQPRRGIALQRLGALDGNLATTGRWHLADEITRLNNRLAGARLEPPPGSFPRCRRTRGPRCIAVRAAGSATSADAPRST